MKKIFTKNLCICMIIAMLVTIIAVATIQTVVGRSSSTRSSHEKLESVEGKLSENDEQVAQLTDTLGQNNLAKARAFADILAHDNSILESMENLNAVMERLMVDELHIIDKDGIITHSTVKEYIGFDMGSGEQSAAFLEIITDPSLEIVQEPQENAAEGILMQYIGVARKDTAGCVQVGVQPKMLQEMLAGNQIDVVLKGIEFGTDGYVYAVDAASGNILAHPKESLIGTSAANAGIPLEEGEGTIKIDGTRGIYVSEKYNDMYIGTFMPTSEYYQNTISQTLVIVISLVVIFVLLLIIINRMIDQKIIQGLHRIIDSVQKISDGNFDISLDERGNKEFSLLSDSVNKMVESIRVSIHENEELIINQNKDMENNLVLIDNIKAVCANLDAASKDTLSTADAIQNGTEEQREAVAELEKVMNELADELNSSANASDKVVSVTEEAVQKIETTGMQMKSLEESIQKISSMSQEIEKIIGDIDAIAQQTNMLSLNASIEAARVGEAGKGFAVVAAQVGELAERSAQAAQKTSILITNSINAVEEGRTITQQTTGEFMAVVEEIKKTSDNVNEITRMVRQNVSTVSLAIDDLGVISHVAEKNMEISQNSKNVSGNMADEAGKLLDLVE